MIVKAATFIGSVALLPIVGQINANAEGTIQKLAGGTAQTVLSVVVVFEALALYKMFKTWREDVESQRNYQEERRDQLEDLLQQNTAAMTRQAASNEQVATAVQKCHEK